MILFSPPRRRFHYMMGALLMILGNTASGRDNLVVKDIRVGSQGDHTRLALILSQSSKLYIKHDAEHQLLKIEAPEDTLWRIPAHSQQSSGLFEKYTLLTNNDGIGVCLVSLRPHTLISDKGLKKTSHGYEYFIDVVEKAPAPPPPPPPATVTIQPVIEIKQTIDTETTKNMIQKVDVVRRNPTTTWLVIRSTQKAFFDFQNIAKEGSLLVYLPKTDWSQIKLVNQAKSMITNVVVDDDNPKQSTIMLMSSGVKDVIDQFISPNQDGSFDCVLVIASRMASPIETHRLLQKKVEAQQYITPPKMLDATVTAPEVSVKTDGAESSSDIEMEDGIPVDEAPLKKLEEELVVDARPTSSPPKKGPEGTLAPTAEDELPPPEWTEQADPLSTDAKYS